MIVHITGIHVRYQIVYINIIEQITQPYGDMILVFTGRSAQFVDIQCLVMQLIVEQHTLMEESVQHVNMFTRRIVRQLDGKKMQQITGINVHSQVVQEYIIKLRTQRTLRFHQMEHITGKLVLFVDT